LAFTWSNLLFACPLCNRSGKNSDFPLAQGSTPLHPEEHPDGREVPLLIDPGADNPMEHIQYTFKSDGRPGSASQWIAEPRGNSIRGAHTIFSCDLNNQEFKELRGDYVENYISPQADILRDCILSDDIRSAEREFPRALSLIKPRCSYAALAYDALTFFVPDALLVRMQRTWPHISAL